MIEIESSIQHCLGQESAVERMRHMVASLAQRFPQQVHQVRVQWTEHRLYVSFAAYGYAVQWDAEIYDDQVALHGRIPDTARQFKGKIEQAIVARVEEVLAPRFLKRVA
ncbi:MAG: polyhydroxyalkanoic acid system family protein [Planctomycetales bacterium]|nr:polyhydroxyalkanoic acid system family protein [Planctomycetales bacterium]